MKNPFEEKKSSIELEGIKHTTMTTKPTTKNNGGIHYKEKPLAINKAETLG